LSLWR
jgi:20S proteasome subunit beta 1